MAKISAWIGAGFLLAGVLLGFVGSAACGSVFAPSDARPPSCATALDLTVPVWLLIGVGVLALVVAVAARPSRLRANDGAV